MENKTDVKVDSENVIQFDGIHDSEIIGLSLSKDGNGLEIRLKTEAGTFFKLHLSGIRRMSCNDFRSQNVVFRMKAIRKKNVSMELQSMQSHLDITTQDLDLLAQQIADGKLFLFQIDASVGCEVICICENVELER